MAIDQEVADAINGVWILVAAILCFFLQAGFGLLEVGSVRAKNAQNIMLKNLLDVTVSALAYWAFGYGIAWGGGGNPFIGKEFFFLDDTNDYIFFFFQFVFAGTTATIVSGAVAERCRFRAYMIYSFVLTGFVYPVAAHWAWNADGFFHGKIIDYAGGGAVHMIGGGAAMAGAYVLGPRIGRFVYDDEKKRWITVDIPGHNAILACLGVFILWMGFFPFNTGSGANIVGEQAIVSGRIAVVTVLASAAGGLTMLTVGVCRTGVYDLSYSMNGVLAGMVSVCSGCSTFHPWTGLVVGSTGALAFYGMAMLFEHPRIRIDDPLGAAPMHLASGAWGMLMVAFFTDPKFTDGSVEYHRGIFYGGDGTLLGWQLAGIIVFFAWSFGTSYLMFTALNCLGWFRVSKEAELLGMDEHHHGGRAYRDFSVTNVAPLAIIDESSMLEDNKNEGPPEKKGLEDEQPKEIEDVELGRRESTATQQSTNRRISSSSLSTRPKRQSTIVIDPGMF